MTDAQRLVDEFRRITEPGSDANTWEWAKRVTAPLSALGTSTIGSEHGRHAYSVAVFRCADGSRFAYDLNGAAQTWAMPDDRKG